MKNTKCWPNILCIPGIYIILDVKSFCIFGNGILCFLTSMVVSFLLFKKDFVTQVETQKYWTWDESRGRDGSYYAAWANHKSVETVKLKTCTFTANEVLKKNGQLRMM